MATYTVTTNSDNSTDGDDLLSLREAISLANDNTGADRIVFANSLSGSRITLNAGLEITDSVVIDGDRNNDDTPDITINGDDAYRIFDVSNGTVALNGLTLEEGKSDGSGGALLVKNGNTVNLTNSEIKDSYGSDGGAAYVDIGAGAADIIPGAAVSRRQQPVRDDDAPVAGCRRSGPGQSPGLFRFHALPG